MSMEKELLNTFDKELLIKDLSSRLPYGVKVNGVFLNYNKDKGKILYEECVKELDYEHLNRYETLKPYLFPLSSMTIEQQKEANIFDDMDMDILSENLGRNHRNKTNIPTATYNYIDWLNKNHFDYRGLIEKGLAIDATGLDIY